MASDLDAQLVRRITSLEDDLFEPIINRASLSSFNSQWANLANDLGHAMDAGALNTSTISMAQELADNIATVAQLSLDLESLSEDLMSSLVLEVSSILGESSNLDPRATPPVITPTDVPKTSTPPYIEPSYRWLLNNLHDPYPPPSVRDSIVKFTGSSRKDIDSWFIDTRKRIGWNALRKAKYHNKRADIVEAATRYFCRTDTQSSADLNAGQDFAQILTCANLLYAEKFSESDLAAKLDIAVKDMTPEMKIQVKAEERRRKILKKSEEQERLRAIACYPSPHRSPSRPPGPSLPSPSSFVDELDPIETRSLAPCKRRGSSVELHDDGPHKRLRTDSPSSNEYLTGLPSPVSSVRESLFGPEDDNLVLPPLPAISSTSRKRRLSDADGQGVPKRPRNLHIGPRLQAVSDPMPFSNALLEASEFDGWFHQQFEPPAGTYSGESGVLAPVEVELFDISKFMGLEDNQIAEVVQYPSPHIEDRIAAKILPQSLNISTNDFNYDELFYEDYAEEFLEQRVGQADDFIGFPYQLPPCTGVDFPTALFSPFENPGQLTHCTDPVQVADPSLPISTNPASNLDWMLPSFVSLPQVDDSPRIKASDVFHLFPQSDAFNFSTMLTPMEFSQSVNHTPQQALAQAERAAKQRKLIEARETARRLEAELAASQDF